MDDLTHLPVLDEAGILACLHERYNSDRIYTGLSDILIAVNPHRSVHTTPSGPSVETMAKNIARTRTNQSVLCSGESGSGKTESAKKIIRGILGSQKHPISDKILASNPILEAFGNAQTTRNHNSSRFAKFIMLHRNHAETTVVSAETTSFLLETSRVSNTPAEECNYHVFYMVANACPGTTWKYAPNVANRKLNLDASYSSIESLRDAFKLIGVKDNLVRSLEAAVKGLLLLGNDDLAGAALELGINPDVFNKCMTTRSIVAGKDRILKSLDATEQETTKTSVARLVYRTVFQWVIETVNAATRPPESIQQDSWIGILDLFGFESFKTNSYEQFCINYANEKLQQLFNRITLDDEQKLYAREGIRWAPVGFTDNSSTVEMLDGKPNGIFSLLDSACILRSAAAVSAFCDSVSTVHSNNPALLTRNHPNSMFTIVHYAGPVKYTCTEFIAKNDDSLHAEAVEMLSTSSNVVVASRSGLADSGGSKRFRSVGKVFGNQLCALVDTIGNSSVKFIRCLNPNGVQKPRQFERDYVANQMKAGGLVETVRVLKHGFPHRVPCELVTVKYAGSLGYADDVQNNPRRMRRACGAILEVVGGLTSNEQETQVLVGMTKIFLKAGHSDVLERIERQSTECSPDIRKRIRKHMTRSHLRSFKGVARFHIRSVAVVRRQRAATEFAKVVRIIQTCQRFARKAREALGGRQSHVDAKAIVSESSQDRLESRAVPLSQPNSKDSDVPATNSVFVRDMMERLETLRNQLEQAKQESETAAKLRQEALEASEWNQALAEAAVAREHELLKWQKRAESMLDTYASTIEAYKVERNDTSNSLRRQTEAHLAEMTIIRDNHARALKDLHTTIQRKDTEIQSMQRQLKQYDVLLLQERRKSSKAR